MTDQTDMFFTVTDALKLDRTLTPPGDPKPGVEPTKPVTTPGDSGSTPSGAAVVGNGANNSGSGNENSLATTGSQIALFLVIAAAFIGTGAFVIRGIRKPRNHALPGTR
ncbi:hypothetical protein [Renibacterium salmoninarum]|uniref:hypothetical protein n=1 Tax=Renibacterium salmoninarum TaxID=1646 RepID=UPI0018F6D7E2|nr:hypothetical protein [Renibacterium salmoninarum]